MKLFGGKLEFEKAVRELEYQIYNPHKMAVNNIIKRIQNIMRQDAGINGDAQRIEQMTWMFFLKVYDTQEETWEYKDENYKSIIPEELRWRNWAVDEKDGEALTGEVLLSFVNEKLFPALKTFL